MKFFVTPEDVDAALDSVGRAVVEILRMPGTTWGPRVVTIAVFVPGFTEPTMRTFGEPDDIEHWDSAWGHPSEFADTAKAKMELALRTGKPTSEIVAFEPWLLTEGDFLYDGGATTGPYGLGVGVSGAYGEVDEGIAGIVLTALVMFCRLKRRQMVEARMSQL